jgi:ABC-type transporter Mla subunit MlaD
MWQAADPLTGRDMHLLMIFAGVIAAALALQSLVIVVAAFKGMQIQKNVMADVAELKAKVLPLVDKAQAVTVQIATVTTDLTPAIKSITGKVDTIAGHVERISALVHEKAEEFAPTVSAANETVAEANETVRDVNRKTQEQIARVNGMVSSVLDATAQVGYSIKRGIQIPGRELGSLATGFKAAFDTFLGRRGGRYNSHVEFHQPYRALITSYRSTPDVLDEGIPGEPREQ